MHGAWILVLILLVREDVANSAPQGDGKMDGDTEKFIISNATTQFPINCFTAKNISGACSEREYCDYGSTIIDLTLYAPSWYKRPCKEGQVCCPFQFLVVHEAQVLPKVAALFTIIFLMYQYREMLFKFVQEEDDDLPRSRSRRLSRSRSRSHSRSQGRQRSHNYRMVDKPGRRSRKPRGCPNCNSFPD